MTREEAIEAYEKGVPVLFDSSNRGAYTWYSHIHGYEVKHDEDEDAEKFFVILLDEKTKRCTIHIKPERVILANKA